MGRSQPLQDGANEAQWCILLRCATDARDSCIAVDTLIENRRGNAPMEGKKCEASL